MVMNFELTSLSTTALSIISRATLQLDGQLDAADSNATRNMCTFLLHAKMYID